MTAIRQLLLRALRVPGEPQAPVGSDWVRIFRASPNYFRYKLALWSLAQLGALAGLVAFGYFASFDFEPRWLRLGLTGLEFASWVGFLVQLPFSYLLVRLNFEMRWYILSDRSLRIREGIVSLREKTMTYANIQQIVIRQNPLQRLLGIADVQVRSAGGGGGSTKEKGGGTVTESMHEAWFRGVDNAEEIRSLVREKVRAFRDSGLGDPDDVGIEHASSVAEAVEAARQLHMEVRALRNNLLARS